MSKVGFSVASLLILTSLAQAKLAPIPASVKRSDFTHALALFSRDRKAEAYALFEKVFSGSQQEHEKLKAATILAFASNKALKGHHRAFYAEYALNHGDGLALKDRQTLLRIAGDGQFDDANLDRAEKHYAELQRVGEDSDKDYGLYKMGWIQLNKRQAAKAFDSWQARLNEGRTMDRQLREAYVRDMGRAWAESEPPTSGQTAQIRAFSWNDAEKALFLEGVVLGVRRIETDKAMENFRVELFQTPYAAEVFTQMLTRNIGFHKNACQILDWSALPVNVPGLPSTTLLSHLNQCLKRKATSDRDRARIVHVAMQLQISGIDRWGRAELLREAGDEKASCQEYVAMGNEEASSKNALLPEDAIQNLLYTCKNTVSEKTVELENAFVLAFTELLEHYSRLGRIDAKAANPFYSITAKLVTLPEFQRALETRVLAHPDIYRKTMFPSIVAEYFVRHPRPGVGETLLAGFAPVPLIVKSAADEVWVEILRSEVSSRLQSGDFDATTAMLHRYLPLNVVFLERRPYSDELWTLWAIGVPENDERFTAQGRDLAQKLIRSLNPSSDDQTRTSALVLALKFGGVEEIWNYWQEKNFNRVMKPELTMRIVQRTFKELSESKKGFASAEATVNVKRDRAGALAWAAYQFSTKEEPTDGDWDQLEDTLSSGAGVFGGGEKPAFVQDLKRLSELRAKGDAIERKRLTLNARLPKDIENLFGGLNNQVESLKAAPWSDPVWLKLAKKLVARNCTLVVDRLHHIRLPKGIDPQVKDVIDQQVQSVVQLVQTWQDQLLQDSQPKPAEPETEKTS